VAHASSSIREDPSLVFHCRRGFFLDPVAHVRQLNLVADRSIQDRIYEVIPSFDWMTVDAGDDVAALQSGLLCGAAGLHGLNHYPVWRSEGFQGNGVGADLFLEADADRTTGHPALLDDLVVHLNRHGRRKRKAHTSVAAVA